ncbi:MAG: hypothetical protein E7171_00030 [Firmicutes bacterium]|nr:hypothetical protein [Bacillota bacterium]
MRRFLFVILCFFGLLGIVVAKDVTDIEELWHLELSGTGQLIGVDVDYIFYVSVETNEDTGISNYKLNSLDKVTQEIKSVDLDSSVDNLQELNGVVIVETESYLYKFDKKLNLLKKKEIDSNFNFYDLIVKGNVLSTNSYSLISLFNIDDDLNISTTVKNEEDSFAVMNYNDLFLYDKDERIINSFKSDYYFKSVIYHNGYFYASATRTNNVMGSTSQIGVMLYKFDSDLNLVNSVELRPNYSFIKKMLIKDGKLYGVTAANSSFAYNINLDTLSTSSTNIDFDWYEGYYLPDLDDYTIKYLYGYKPFKYDEYISIPEEYYLYDYYKNDNNEKLIVYTDFDNSGVILFDDNIEEPIFSKEYEFLDEFNITASFYGDYILVYTYTDKGLLEIFDRAGNLKKKIETNLNSFEPASIELHTMGDGFVLIRSNDNSRLKSPKLYSSKDTFIKDNTKAMYVPDYKYEFVYFGAGLKVETNTFGKGTVNLVNDNYNVGDVVSFKYAPDTGYVIDKVIVKDEQGNNIEVKGDTFVMPNSNVVIEVYFVESVVNPNTGVFMSIGASLLFIIAAVVIVVLNRTKVQKYE